MALCENLVPEDKSQIEALQLLVCSPAWSGGYTCGQVGYTLWWGTTGMVCLTNVFEGSLKYWRRAYDYKNLPEPRSPQSEEVHTLMVRYTVCIRIRMCISMCISCCIIQSCSMTVSCMSCQNALSVRSLWRKPQQRFVTIKYCALYRITMAANRAPSRASARTLPLKV